jgi:hypothetical protein
MSMLAWTYEVQSAGAGASGIEEFVVYDCHGGDAGKVVSVVEHREGVFLVVDGGTRFPPHGGAYARLCPSQALPRSPATSFLLFPRRLTRP